ncbi:MAG: putative poly glycohydrolase, partial [Streblomastix strix]
RRALLGSPDWLKSRKTLCHVTLDIGGLIEDAPIYCYKVDFANRWPGGGVLNYGCVQEEILFMIYPELLLSIMFCEALNDNEAILIEGAERFSKYKGYSSEFEYDGDYQEQGEIKNGILESKFIVIDALNFNHPQQNGLNNQWGLQSLWRETNKAFIGFSFVPSANETEKQKAQRKWQNEKDNKGKKEQQQKQIEMNSKDQGIRLEQKVRDDSDQVRSGVLATGHWGCGAFNGDSFLKFIIQWIAASEAGVTEMRYSCMNNKGFILFQ